MMINWGLATQVFIVGVSVVMFVMFALQVSITATSAVARFMEKSMEKQKGKNT